MKIINIDGVDYIPLAMYEELDSLYGELDEAHDALVDHPSELDDDERKAKKKRDRRNIKMFDRLMKMRKAQAAAKEKRNA